MTLPNNYSHGLINRDETIPNEQVRKGMTRVFFSCSSQRPSLFKFKLIVCSTSNRLVFLLPIKWLNWIGTGWEASVHQFLGENAVSILSSYQISAARLFTHQPPPSSQDHSLTKEGNVAWNESYGDLFKSQPRPSQISSYLFVFGLLQHQHFTHSTPFISSKKVPILVHCIMYIIVYCKC